MLFRGRTASEATPLARGRAAAGGGAGAQHGTFIFDVGLSSREAARRQFQEGMNIFEVPQGASMLHAAVAQSRNVFVLLTFALAVAAHELGDAPVACLLAALAFAVVAIGALGERGGSPAADACAAICGALLDGNRSVVAVRDGAEVSVKAQDLVVGDVVRLRVGDVVPADLILLDSTDLAVNESALTGQPRERRKYTNLGAAGGSGEDTLLPNVVYAGTSVVAGVGTGEVVATGIRTQLGHIAAHMKASAPASRPGPMHTSANHLGASVALVCAGVAATAAALAFIRGYRDPQEPCLESDRHCMIRSSLVAGFRLAVLAVPHGLPLALLVLLRVGRDSLASRRLKIRRWTAVDRLGAVGAVCMDATGALTQGKLAAKELIGLCRAVPDAPAMELHMELYPVWGLSANGGVFEASKLTQEARQRMDAKFDASERRQDFAEIGLPDLSAPHAAEASHLGSQLVQAHLVSGFLNCCSAKLLRDPANGAWSTSGRPHEAAMTVAAAKGGFWEEEGLGARLLHVTYARRFDLEVPLVDGRSVMATVHALPRHRALASLQFADDATHCAILRGPPEVLVPRVRAVLALAIKRPRGAMGAPGSGTASPKGGSFTGAGGASFRSAGDMSERSQSETPSRPGGSRLLVPGTEITAAERRLLEARGRDLAARGLDGLVVAVCPLSAQEVEDLNRADGPDARLEALLNAPSLCFLTLWGIADPLRVAAPECARRCREAGIRFVMVTGDEPAAAAIVARQAGILTFEDTCRQRLVSCASTQPRRFPLHVPEAYGAVLSRAAAVSLEVALRARAGGSLPLVDRGQGSEGSASALRVPTWQDLAPLASHADVWAEALPPDKVAVVDALMYDGHITAMVGACAGNAAAMARADTGVAVGHLGDDVARRAADVTLRRGDLSALTMGVAEGRRVHANARKCTAYMMAANAGECACVLLAIMLRLPLPLRGLQYPTNLVAVHLLPSLALAWERPEPHIMRVPPRDTKSHVFLLPERAWLLRWVPIVVCLPLMAMTALAAGVWTNTGFLGSGLAMSSEVGAVVHGVAACEVAGILDGRRDFIADAAPYRCRCHVRPTWSPLAPPKQVDQWGRDIDPLLWARLFDKVTGDARSLFDAANTPWKDGPDVLLEPCVDRNGVVRRCWRVGEHRRPRLPVDSNCAAYGMRLGQSMAYATIQLGELATLLSFRSESAFVTQLLTNKAHFALTALGLGALAVALYVPPVAGAMGLAPLSGPRLGVSVALALVVCITNEVAKVLYRGRMHSQHSSLGKIAMQLGYGVESPKEC